jgi:hypothetical protein
MRRWGVGACIALSGLALTACGIQGIGSATGTTIPQPSFDQQLAFMHNMVQDNPAAGNVKMAVAVKAAVLMCDALLNGESVNDFIRRSATTGVSPDFVSALLVEGTHFFCPSEFGAVGKAVLGNSG